MVLLIFFALLLLCCLPLGEVTRVSPMLTLSFTLLDVAVLLGSITWVIRQLVCKKKPISFQAKTFALFTGALILSLVVNITSLSPMQFVVSGLYIVRWVMYGVLFFMVFGVKHIKKYVKLLLMGSGILVVLGGYAQYFLYPNLRNLVYYGWDAHFYRMFGTLFDPNFYGLFVVLIFLFVLFQLFKTKVEKEKIRFVLLFLYASSIFIAIFLTYSRTALVALVAGVVVLFWKKEYWKWLVASIAVILCTALVVFFVSTRKQDMNSLLRTTSSNARIGSAKNALVIFLEKPILGVGFNAYRYAQYRHHFMNGSPTQEDHGASGADSSLLLLLATSGIVGFAAFLFLLWSHVKALIRAPRIGMATLVAFLIGSFFVNGLFYPALLVWVWIVLGLIESGGR